MKYSKQRDEILKAVLNSSSHPNAYDIYEDVKLILPNISLGTIYRNLNVLSENGLIKKICNSNGEDHYDKTLYDHSHFYCNKCHTMKDIAKDKEENIYSILRQNNDDTILNVNIIVFGICFNCKEGTEVKWN